MISNVIFGILCGCLYVVGLPFGWDYKETSVYICIYLWPMLCVASTLPISLQLIRNIVYGKKVGLSWLGLPFAMGYTYIYLSTAVLLMGHYLRYLNFEGIDGVFDNCMRDLMNIANTCHVSYATANLYIYVVLFILIVAFNLGLWWLTRRITSVKKTVAQS